MSKKSEITGPTKSRASNEPKSTVETKRHKYVQSWRNDNIGRALFEATRRFEQDVLASLTKQGYSFINLAHLTLFRHIDLDGTRLTDLAGRAGMTKQGMQDLVDRLEKLGVLERRPDPNDRRGKFLVFSALGLKIFDAVRQAVLKGDQQIAGIVGVGDVQWFKGLLRQYARR